MFKSFKLNRLVSSIVSLPGEKHTEPLHTLREYGQDGLAALIHAFKSNKIAGKDMKSYLSTFYDKSVLDLFIKLLGDSKEALRDFSMEVIEKRGGLSAVGPLVDAIKDGNFLQKRCVVSLLKKVGGTAVTDKVMPLLDGDDREVKGTVLDILSGIGGEKGIESMVRLLSASDWWVRKKAVTALCRLKDPAIIDPLLSQLDKEKDPKIKKVVIQTIGEIGNADSAKRLLPQLAEDDLIVRQMVVEAVEKTADVSIIPHIIDSMKDADVNVRRSGVEILQKIKDPIAITSLIQRLQDPDWWVREIATDALADIRTPEINEQILKLFESGDENVRRAAVEFFKRVPDKIAYDSLVTMLKDSDWWVREKAVEALGKLKDEKAIEHILPMLDDADVRLAVPIALGEIGGEKATCTLCDYLKDPDRAVRQSAVKALGTINNQKTLPQIKEAVLDEDPTVSEAALNVIREMTGRTVRASDVIAELERKQQTAAGGSAVSIGSEKAKTKGTILTEAILVLDLANFTETGSKYGDQFAMKLKEGLMQIVGPLAKTYKAQFYKSTGDGFLMTFPELLNALKFSKEVTCGVVDSNQKVPEKERIAIRMAVHEGETRIDDNGDRLGTAVNMTFRVEGISPKNLFIDEGGMKPEDIPLVNRIMVTEAVNREIADNKEFETVYVGFFDLKGISGRHRIFQLSVN